MRLLKTDPHLHGQERLELVEHHGSNIPPYAILSHTWGEDEVLFADVRDRTASQRQAFSKVISAMKQAHNEGYHFIWIDTLCIDKSSSAELSEAINSMYAWYQKAEKCYAYLADVSNSDATTRDAGIRDSRWFKRGWTLQELLAPKHLEFFDRDWASIGDKQMLQWPISGVTRIEVEYLTGHRPVQLATVAARMSWAADRHTTREEDTAYCLMGLFSINMPMLYGEGDRAFLRLQEEIMKHSDDQSLFAWTVPRNPAIDTKYDAPQVGRRRERRHGLLADSPEAFSQAGSIITWNNGREQAPYVMTNRGLSIELYLTDQSWPGGYLATLDCCHASEVHSSVALCLKKLDSGPSQYTRVAYHKLDSRSQRQQPGTLTKIFVRQETIDAPFVQPPHFLQCFTAQGYRGRYRFVEASSAAKVVTTPGPARGWQAAFTERLTRISMILVFKRELDGDTVTVMLGSLANNEVGYAVGEPDKPSTYLNRAQSTLYWNKAQSASASCMTESGYHGVWIDVQLRPEVDSYVIGVHITSLKTNSADGNRESSLALQSASLDAPQAIDFFPTATPVPVDRNQPGRRFLVVGDGAWLKAGPPVTFDTRGYRNKDEVYNGYMYGGP